MNRIVAWFYAEELKRRDEAAYNRGFIASNGHMMEALRREKIFLFGEAPVNGLNEFLAHTPARNISVIGCHFGSAEAA